MVLHQWLIRSALWSVTIQYLPFLCESGLLSHAKTHLFMFMQRCLC